MVLTWDRNIFDIMDHLRRFQWTYTDSLIFIKDINMCYFHNKICYREANRHTILYLASITSLPPTWQTLSMKKITKISDIYLIRISRHYATIILTPVEGCFGGPSVHHFGLWPNDQSWMFHGWPCLTLRKIPRKFCVDIFIRSVSRKVGPSWGYLEDI